MHITIHALNRFAERFPDVKLSIYEAVEQAVPFGKHTKDYYLLLQQTHGIIFPVCYSHKLKEYHVVTALTTDQALIDMQLKHLLPRKYAAYAAKKIDKTPLTLEQNDPVVAQLYIKARNAAAKWEYAYPEPAQQKAIMLELTAQGFSKKAVIKYYWSEVNRVIYEHNVRQRQSNRNVSNVETR